MSKLTKNKKGGAFALVLIIILIVAAVFIIPKVVSGEEFSFEGIWDEIVAAFTGLFGGGGGGDSDGYVGVGFTIYYADGNSEDFGVSPTFQISPLTITVTGKDVNRIDVFVRAKFITSEVTTWSADVTQQIEVYKVPSEEPQFSSTGYFSESGDSWGAGTVKNLAVTVLDASIIDDLVADYGVGEWFLQVNVSVDLEATIDGVNSHFDALAPSGGLTFAYTDTDSADSIKVKTKDVPIS